MKIFEQFFLLSRPASVGRPRTLKLALIPSGKRKSARNRFCCSHGAQIKFSIFKMPKNLVTLSFKSSDLPVTNPKFQSRNKNLKICHVPKKCLSLIFRENWFTFISSSHFYERVIILQHFALLENPLKSLANFFFITIVNKKN